MLGLMCPALIHLTWHMSWGKGVLGLLLTGHTLQGHALLALLWAWVVSGKPLGSCVLQKWWLHQLLWMMGGTLGKTLLENTFRGLILFNTHVKGDCFPWQWTTEWTNQVLRHHISNSADISFGVLVSTLHKNLWKCTKPTLKLHYFLENRYHITY